MKWLAAFAFVTVALALWVAVIRPRYRNDSRWEGFFRAIEPVEQLWYKSEAMLWAWWWRIAGVAVGVLTLAGGIDWTPFTQIFPEWFQPLVPFTPPAALYAAGHMDALIRKDISKPLERVAIPSDAPEDVKAADADAEAVNKEAVAMAKAAT